MGYRDFSGCGPVHLLGGTCSLFGAAFLGPRLGRFSSKAEDSQKMPGHSVPVSVTTVGLVLMEPGLRGSSAKLAFMKHLVHTKLILSVMAY